MNMPSGSFSTLPKLELLKRVALVVAYALAFVAIICAVTLPSWAAPVQTDSTFGTNGVAVTPMSPGSEVTTAALLHADGKLFIAGRCALDEPCYTRLNADGSIDASMQETPVIDDASVPPRSYAFKPTAVALQQDGKYVLAGRCLISNAWQFCVLRLNENGGNDTGFGASGLVTLSFAEGQGRTPQSSFSLTAKPCWRGRAAHSSAPRASWKAARWMLRSAPPAR